MRAFQNTLLGPALRKLAGPQAIIEAGMAFWSSRLILSAVHRGIFTLLALEPLTGDELIERLGWHPRAAPTALEALVACGLLRRDKAGRYSNSFRASMFLDREKPTYIGGLMELSSTRLYELWAGLDGLLETGVPAAEEERGENKFFDMLYRDPVVLRTFLSGMTGISTGEATMLAARFPWKRFATFADMGCAQGALAVRVALTHSHLRGIGFDLPVVEPIFTDYVKSFGLDDRLAFVAGDFFTDDLPRADVLSFGHVFHGQSYQDRCDLAAHAFDALPGGGALIVYDAMPTWRRSMNHFHSLLSSLNIMLETRDGYEATTTDCAAMLRGRGFCDVTVRHLIGPTSMVYGFKP
ncbi:methyltransferase [Mycobacterium sp. 1274761.0]|nr:methyltransferase [Mycobacterium sp. 1274761.0]